MFHEFRYGEDLQSSKVLLSAYQKRNRVAVEGTPTKNEREFQIILWGATSFVGQIIAEYLFHRLGADGEIRWALAARNEEKLEGVKAGLGPEAASLPTFIGDSFDPQFLENMASRTRVVLTTVGPYSKYGEPLVEACAKQGTDYCELTGEIAFVQSMMDKYDEEARSSGARFADCAGFDSLPSDLGMLFLNDFAQREHESSLKTVEMQGRRRRGLMGPGLTADQVICCTVFLIMVRHELKTLKSVEKLTHFVWLRR